MKTISEKVCSRCKELKPIDYFIVVKNKNGTTRRATICRDCRSLQQKERRNACREVKQQAPKGSMYCFRGHRKVTRRDGTLWCKECNKIARIKYVSKPGVKDRDRETSIKWHSENRERSSVATREWQENNKTKLREYQKEYFDNKYNNDLNYKKAQNIRSRTQKAMKRWVETGEYPKFKKTSVHGDIDYMSIILHLGKPPGEMGMGAGKYTIGHTPIPLRSVDLSKPQNWYAVTHWRNCQWQTWEENYNEGSDFNDASQELLAELVMEYFDKKGVE